MPGLDTESLKRRLKAGNYAQFLNLTNEGGKLTPLGTDETFTPGAGQGFLYDSLGVNSVAEVDFGEDDGELFAYAPYSGGPATLRDSVGTEEPVSIAPPGVQAAFWFFAYTLLENGLATGETATYAAVYRSEGLTTKYQSGFGEVEPVQIENDGRIVPHGVITGAQPSQGDTLTNATKGTTGTNHDSSYSGSVGTLVIRESEKSAAATWESGDSITWAGGSTTLTGDEFTGFLLPGFERPAETAPDGAGAWQLHRLHTDGNWYALNEDGYDLDATPRYDNTYFPYSDQAQEIFLTLYDGPYDQNGFVEELIVPPDAQFVVEHNGSLYLACGRYLYRSEVLEYRHFVKDRRLDAGAEIKALVSRGDWLEVWTEETLQLLFGTYPNERFRKSGLQSGPTEALHVAEASVGTFAFLPDDQNPTVGLFGPKGFQPITRGRNTPWLRLITDDSGVVVGAGEGSCYIVNPTAHADGSYRALVYTWSRDEWREQTFVAAPLGFRYDEQTRVMAIRTGASVFSKLETGTADRTWTLEGKERGAPRLDVPPERLFVDADGDLDFALYIDDALEYQTESTAEMSGEREVILPEQEGRAFRYVFSGTGSKADTEFRGYEEL